VSARFVRQVLVAEVGSAGQAAIEAASVEIAADGLTSETFLLYATAAGFGEVHVHPAHIPGSDTAAAAAVLEGARAAVRAIVATLDAAKDSAK
jgi:hypothetical protein